MSVNISICMGSSCFARGNDRNLSIIEQYIKEYDLDATVDLCGSRCEGDCSIGPNLSIDGKIYNKIDSGTLLDLLNEKLCAKKDA